MKADKLDKAKTQLVLEHPFWASILLRRPLIKSTSVPTCGIDIRGRIYYNEDWLMKLEVPQIKFVLAHEVGHHMWHHLLRRGQRDPMLWNYAGDAVINDMLIECEVGEKVPNGVFIKGAGNRSVDDVYNELFQNAKKIKINLGDIGADMLPGDGEGGGDLTDEEKDALEASVRLEVQQAANAARMRGKLPGNLERLVEEMIHPKTPWYEILERWMVDRVKNEYNYSKANRRFMTSKVFLPQLDSIGSLGEIVVQIDTSGSIGARELACFGGHLNRIIELCHPRKVHVLYVDAAINHHDEFTSDNYPVQLNAHGGGGTDMRLGFDWVQEQGIEPACHIVLTDGYTPFPNSVDYPTIWAISTDVTAPDAAGETVHFEMDEEK